jgi:cell division protein FtsA
MKGAMRAFAGRKAGPGIVAALDIGTAKTACLIARMDGQGQMRVLGSATQASQGVRNAAIVDIAAAGHSAGMVVQSAETAARQKVDSVLVNLSAGQILSERVQAAAALSDRAIGTQEVTDVLAIARSRAPLDGRALLHFVPLGYAVDGAKGIRDPRGLFGGRLELETLVVSTPEGVLRTLRTAVGRAHLEVEGVVVSGYAAGLSVLHQDERDLGVTVIDMGAGSTSVAVFSEGEPVYCGSIPLGGAHITSDIARGLSTPLPYAERLKTLQGSCLPSADDDRDLIDLQPICEMDDGDSMQAPRSLLVRIIRARMEEIFEMVRQLTASADMARLAGGAVVLTGGAAQLHGVADLATQVLDKRARIGRPGGIAGLGDMAGSPEFATAVGMLLYAQRQFTGGPGNAVLNLGKPQGMLARLSSMLRIGI